MPRYRVELWIADPLDPNAEGRDPDRMPDVNVMVTARDAVRATRAAYVRALRVPRLEDGRRVYRTVPEYRVHVERVRSRGTGHGRPRR